MDRKGPRGTKPKNVPLPGNLITLGNKAAGRSEAQLDKSSHGSSYSQSKSSGSTGDRVRDGSVSSSSNLLSKKSSKSSFPGTSGVSRSGPQKSSTSDMVNLLSEEWENVAEEVEAEDLIPFVEQAAETDDQERVESYLCGAVKTLKSQRMKPDSYLCLSIMYLSKIKPHLFLNSNLVVEAFCSLLRRDHSMSYKTKGNVPICVLAANVLLAVYQDEKQWPDLFIRVFIDDSLGERLWVDHEDCKYFVDNIIAAFRTKMPPKSLSYPDIGIGNRTDCSSPPISSAMETNDPDYEISLECKESMDANVTNHYVNEMNEVDEIVMEAVQHQLGLRHTNVDAVARNFIRFLVSVCGIVDVRRAIAPRLEMWLQSHKVQRPATELLMSICMNCNTHNPIDIEVIIHIIKIRLKSKLVINQYMACLRELLGAHPSNIGSVLKHTIYNELSQARNPSNMNIISVVFQYAPEHSAIILADEFLELLNNRDDFLRALRALLREIVRALRYDMQYVKFCIGLMKDRKDAHFRENIEFKERMFHSITDLIVLTMFVSISPQIREAAQSARADPKESEPVRKFQDMVATIQTEALHWMHKIVPKYYSPSKEEFVHCLHKILMFEAQESYYGKDNWPVENDRPAIFRLTAEAPVNQDTLTKLLLLGVTKDQWIKPQDLIELADKLIKRATSLHNDHVEMLFIQDTKIIELIFNLCPYVPPEESKLPPGYRPPKTAIAILYWKAWIMLLLITAHNPGVFGVLAWESYPTLRTLMEMCITNSFVFPPPTLAVGEKGEEMTAQEMHLCARERQQILEFESHLARNTITDQNSLLLSQLITMEPTGPARKPPGSVLEQLKSLNAVNKIGHLLCRCRNPDFLLDIIQRQGASQSMPWLAELVQSSEGALSGLPVQCLCEFLLSEAVTGGEGTVAARHHQLLQHLQSLLTSPRQDDGVSVEILEYFLRRLSSQQASARSQAIRGLQLVVAPINDAMDVDTDPHDQHAWLLQHLPQLPGFASVRSVASQALRVACQFETNPQSVSAYIRFLAVHTREDSLQDQAALVQDMAQLIVERCTMISAILPGLERPGQYFPHCHSTLKALLIIFINYMRGVRVLPRESYTWPETQDHVRIHWVSGEQAVMHILVVHAMVILLTYGPSLCSDLFHELLNTWFPENQLMPTGFLVDTSEEALLLPDWLKLKMIRSTVPQLVDAALRDLEPSQLVLFIQSFGIPVESMTKLLYALDVAVNTNEEAVAAAVLDKSHKTYMSQLVEVQHQRGAEGGHAFAATLGERDDDIPAERQPPIPPLVTPLKGRTSNRMEFKVKDFSTSFLLQYFTNDKLHKESRAQVRETMRVLMGHLSREISGQNIERPYCEKLVQNFNVILFSTQSNQASKNINVSFVLGLHRYHQFSAPLFRLLDRLKNSQDGKILVLYNQVLQISNEILRISPAKPSPLSKILAVITSAIAKSGLSTTMNKENSKIISTSYLKTEMSVLAHLKSSLPHQLEKQIQSLVSIAMQEGKMEIVVAALTRLLVSSVSIKSEPDSNESHPPVALLLDWLHVLDPELRSSPDNLRQLLLFGKRNFDIKDQRPMDLKIDQSISGYNQAYLLAAFTHQATWKTLEETVRGLLRVPSTNLDPGSVLDFIWAVLHVPKLWQGRERRTPRHIQSEPLLILEPNELVNLAQYILAECQQQIETNKNLNVQTRMSLLFYCSGNSKAVSQSLVNYLISVIDSKSQKSTVTAALHLLYQYYLKQPKIFRHLSSELYGKLVSLQKNADDGQSLADVAVHTLLTMLTNPLQEKNFQRRMHDLDVAMRKLVSTHPLLVLRHLPLLSASLHGISHLRIEILKMKNYLLLFSIVMGLLELLQPLLFANKYKKSFCNTLDAFLELLDNHGENYELAHILVRLCHLLLAWVGCQGNIAGTYLSSHVKLLTSLQHHHPDMTALRSLTAIAASRGTDHPTEETTSDEMSQNLSSNWQGPPIHPLMIAQARDIQMRLENSTLPEEQLDLFRKVMEFGDRSYNAILPLYSHIICEGILNTHKEVSSICWLLLAKLLHFQPNISKRVSSIVLNALHSKQATVAEIAVEHLPEVVLLLHDDAPDLLTAAFTTCLSSAPSATNALSEAVALLSIHTGA